jgi:hypothetical protein
VKTLLRIEELFLALLSVFLFALLDISWWWFVLLFLAPDLGALGYLVNPRVGAFTYNLTHHKAVALAAYLIGTWAGRPPLQCAGLIILAHSSFDRVLGFGLKYPDSFQHTHLGKIGRGAQT